jgi:hypothetical protein
VFWQYAKEKKKARQFALPDREIVNGIWLPADQALCVRLAYENNLMRRIENAILVENDPTIYQKMLDVTTDIPCRRPFLGNLTKINLTFKVDYAFLDYLGGMNVHTAPWMASELSNHLREGATVCITQMLALRGNRLLPKQDFLLRTDAGSFIRNHYGSLKLPYQRILLLVHRIFRDWDFEIVPNEYGHIYEYADSVTTMLLLKLVNFRRSTYNLFPLLEGLK